MPTKFFTPPQSLIESLDELVSNSATSAPQLSIETRQLITALEKGQKTTANGLGIATFQEYVDTLSAVISRVDIANNLTHKKILNVLRSQIAKLSATLEAEPGAVDDVLPLMFFSRVEEDIDIFRQFRANVLEMEELLDSQPVPKSGIHVNFTGACIDTTIIPAGGVPHGGAGGGNIGSYITGHLVAKAAGARFMTPQQDVLSHMNSNAGGSFDSTSRSLM